MPFKVFKVSLGESTHVKTSRDRCTFEAYELTDKTTR